MTEEKRGVPQKPSGLPPRSTTLREFLGGERALAVLECGGRDTAFDRFAISKERGPVQTAVPSQSGVALRLPPHSTTLREFSGRCNSIGNGFTLIELLTVIAVIGVLAALLLPVAGAVKRREYINTATAEMQKIETALERYKAQYGFYPPAGTNVLENPLYAELVGTTNVANVGNVGVFNSLDGNVQGITNAFGMSGFVNCSKPGAGGESSQAATDFIGELKTTQIAAVTNINNIAGTNALLTVSVGGPDTSYKPVGIQGVNPWRYAYPGTNNPSSYDLWVQLVISGKTNLVCNWSDKVQLNAPYP